MDITDHERFDADAASRLAKMWEACDRIKRTIARMGHITRLELLPPQLDVRRSSEETP